MLREGSEVRWKGECPCQSLDVALTDSHHALKDRRQRTMATKHAERRTRRTGAAHSTAPAHSSIARRDPLAPPASAVALLTEMRQGSPFLTIDGALSFLQQQGERAPHRDTVCKALRRERKQPGTGLRGLQIGGHGRNRQWRTTRTWLLQ